LERALSVFGSETAARTWMTRPAIGLGGLSAAELFSTEEGRQQLLDYLGRLEMGGYS
jgi:putative toxin-antitoxin system antitoxin component (TIGR02293 family)